MRKVSFFLAIFIFMCANSYAGLLYYDDCEGTAIDAVWIHRVAGTNCTATVSTDQARAGNKSYKIISGVGCRRSEIDGPDIDLGGDRNMKFAFGQVYWIGFSIYIPNDYVEPVTWGTFYQTHVTNDACDYALNQATTQSMSIWQGGSTATPTLSPVAACVEPACSMQDYTWYCNAGSCNGPGHGTSNLNKGAWNDIVMQVEFNHDAVGLNRIWHNGVLFFENDYEICNAKNDTYGPYPKFGIYSGSTTGNQTFYYDEIKIGDANSSYNEVAPGGAVNVAPTVAIDTPVGNQSIALDEALNFTCTASDSDGTISSYLWDFDDSGIAQSSSEDPGSKTFSQAGTYTVRITVTDNDGATASDTVNVVVSAATITGLINNWQMESGGAITTDNEGNEDLINNGSITSEGSATEPTWDQGGTWGVTLNGTDQYFSVANWDASNPWQTGKPKGTFVVALKTPATAPLLRKGLAGRYDTDGGRVVGFFLNDNSGMSPGIFTGFNAGGSYEAKYSNINLSTASRYIIVFTVDDELHIWAIYTYDAENTTWLSPATGSITNAMSLSESTAWNIGRWQTQYEYNFYFAGTLYAALIYNTVLTEEEAEQLVSGSYTPPSPTNTIESTCIVLGYPDNTDCATSDVTFHTGEKICMRVNFGGDENYTYDGTYSNFEWPYTLDAGSLGLLYHGGSGTNTWFFCDYVTTDDVETGDVELATVNDFEKNRTGLGASTIVNESGNEITYAAPQVAIDPNYSVRIYGVPHVWFGR